LPLFTTVTVGLLVVEATTEAVVATQQEMTTAPRQIAAMGLQT
jgi:hypothetical protein